MNHQLRRSAIVCVLGFLLVVSAGCLGAGGQSDLPDEETVADSLDSIEAINATVTVEMTVGNDTTELTVDLARRTQTGEVRATVHQQPADVRYRIVSNGSSMWVYNQSTNTARELRFEGIETEWESNVESISGIFGALERSAGDEDVSISPLPVVPGGGSTRGTVGVASMPSMGNVSLSYEGTSTIDGREAYVVDVRPATNASVITNGTLWIDTDRYLPIKSEYQMSVGGQPRTVTMVYRNLTYNPGIPDGAFVFDPPPNATIEASESVSVHQTRSELEAGTAMSVPRPEIPDGHEFAQASTARSGANRSLAMQYSNGSGTIVVSKVQGPVARQAEGSDGETVRVAGREGTYRTIQQRGVLVWHCEETRYVVQAATSKSRLQSIAQSVACE